MSRKKKDPSAVSTETTKTPEEILALRQERQAKSAAKLGYQAASAVARLLKVEKRLISLKRNSGPEYHSTIEAIRVLFLCAIWPETWYKYGQQAATLLSEYDAERGYHYRVGGDGKPVVRKAVFTEIAASDALLDNDDAV